MNLVNFVTSKGLGVWAPQALSPAHAERRVWLRVQGTSTWYLRPSPAMREMDGLHVRYKYLSATNWLVSHFLSILFTGR